MKLVFTPEARDEVEMIAGYYSAQFSTGAGDFLDAMVDTLDILSQNPKGFQVKFIDENGFPRRGIQVKSRQGSENYAKKFPYVVLYYFNESSEEVVITEIFPTNFPEQKMRGRS